MMVYNPFLHKEFSVNTNPDILRIDLGITKSMFYLEQNRRKRHALQALIDGYEEVIALQTQPRL